MDFMWSKTYKVSADGAIIKMLLHKELVAVKWLFHQTFYNVCHNIGGHFIQSTMSSNVLQMSREAFFTIFCGVVFECDFIPLNLLQCCFEIDFVLLLQGGLDSFNELTVIKITPIQTKIQAFSSLLFGRLWACLLNKFQIKYLNRK